MPRNAESTSSSSSEEDLAAFQSVAVSFEEITSKQREVAEQAKQRIAGSANRKRSADVKRAVGREDSAVEQDSGPENDGPWDQLDPFQLKVALALDSMLEGRLKIKMPGPKKLRREARAHAETDADTDDTFRFFARVAPGERVVLEPYEPPPPPGTPFPDLFHLRHAPTAEEVAAALPKLAVDGAALLAAGMAAVAAATGNGIAAAAAAAAAPCPPADGLANATQEVKTQQQHPNKQKQKSQLHLGEGVVVDPRVFVPHNDRIQRLVGGSGRLSHLDR